MRIAKSCAEPLVGIHAPTGTHYRAADDRSLAALADIPKQLYEATELDGAERLQQFFLTVSQEMVDAARVDGCSELGVLWRVVLPRARPALARVALLEFVAT